MNRRYPVYQIQEATTALPVQRSSADLRSLFDLAVIVWILSIKVQQIPGAFAIVNHLSKVVPRSFPTRWRAIT